MELLCFPAELFQFPSVAMVSSHLLFSHFVSLHRLYPVRQKYLQPTGWSPVSWGFCSDWYISVRGNVSSNPWWNCWENNLSRTCFNQYMHFKWWELEHFYLFFFPHPKAMLNFNLVFSIPSRPTLLRVGSGKGSSYHILLFLLWPCYLVKDGILNPFCPRLLFHKQMLFDSLV